MKRAAPWGALLILALGGVASSQTRVGEPRALDCVPPAQIRNLYLANKLAQPLRAMREAAAESGGEAIGLQLCRFNDVLVYDVTLLQPDGRVTHRLINAATGVPLTGRAPP